MYAVGVMAVCKCESIDVLQQCMQRPACPTQAFICPAEYDLVLQALHLVALDLAVPAVLS
jgi:hypothetical protein